MARLEIEAGSASNSNRIRMLRKLALATILFPSLVVAGCSEQRRVEVEHFFHFYSEYSYNGEKVEFDTIVSCHSNYTKHNTGEWGVRSGVTPSLFAKELSDGSALMVVTPDICTGTLRENFEQKYRKNFIPMTVWFKDASDLSVGVGYSSEDAYENEVRQLRLVASFIGKASRQDWDNYSGELAENLVKRDMIRPRLGAQREDWDKYHSWHPGKKYFATSCHSAFRLEFDTESAKILRSYWPSSRPKYWAPSWKVMNELGLLEFLHDKARFIGPDGESYPKRDFVSSIDRDRGIPLRTGEYGIGITVPGAKFPSTHFPLFRNEGPPFLDKNVNLAGHYTISIMKENNKGFSACYSNRLVNPGTDLESYYFPSGKHLPYIYLVDGQKVFLENEVTDQKFHMFEEDKYYYSIDEDGIQKMGGVD